MDETIWIKLIGDRYSTYSVYYVKISIIKVCMCDLIKWKNYTNNFKTEFYPL